MPGSRGGGQFYDLAIFWMARIDNCKVHVAQKSYLLLMERGVASDGIVLAVPLEAQAVIASRRQAHKLDWLPCNRVGSFPDLMHLYLICGLHEAGGAKGIHKIVDQVMYTSRTV